MTQASKGWSESLFMNPKDCHHLLVRALGMCKPGQEPGREEQGAQERANAADSLSGDPEWSSALLPMTELLYIFNAPKVIKSRNLFDLFLLLFPQSLKARLEPSFLDLKGKYLIN